MNGLMLHCGGYVASLDQIDAVPTPVPPTPITRALRANSFVKSGASFWTLALKLKRKHMASLTRVPGRTRRPGQIFTPIEGAEPGKGAPVHQQQMPRAGGDPGGLLSRGGLVALRGPLLSQGLYRGASWQAQESGTIAQDDPCPGGRQGGGGEVRNERCQHGISRMDISK